MTSTIGTLLTRNLLEVFNERDPKVRAEVMAEIYSAGITFYETEQVTTGAVAVGRRVQQLLDDAPGLQFTADGEPLINHSHGHLSWKLGPAGGPAIVKGTDVVEVRDGHIVSLYTFLTLSPADAK
ncbi:MAG: nuclear transport factor 2 family protein [Nakamurella sp.]